MTIHVCDDWPTPNACLRAADALDALSPARYGDILRAYALAEDERFTEHGPIRAVLAAHDERIRADERERLAGELDQFAAMLPIPQSRDALLAVAARLRLAQARCEDVVPRPPS